MLHFDFAHDGQTEVVSSTKCPRKLEVKISQKTASVKLTLPNASKGIEEVPLTGELAKDRFALHQIHDTLFQALYGAPGIASTRILYTVRSRKGNDPEKWGSEVWSADYDGANAKPQTAENCLCVTPTFIPTKSGGRCRHYLYVSYKIGQPKIFAASLEDQVGKRLTYLRGNQLMPAVSPTLDKIAFIGDITGNPDLFIQDFSIENGMTGKPRQVFCAAGAAQGTPTFSPDGKTLAFVSNKDGTPRIYMLEIPFPGLL